MAADSLSRVFFMAWSEPQSHLLQEIKYEVKVNTQLQVLVKECLNQSHGNFPYSSKDGLSFWRGRIVLAVCSFLARISAQFFWPKLKEYVKLFVQQCTVGQQAKTENFLPAGLLQPLPIPQPVWEDVAVDFIIELPNSFGFMVNRHYGLLLIV